VKKPQGNSEPERNRQRLRAPAWEAQGICRGRRTFGPVPKDLECPSAGSCSHHNPTQKEQTATVGKVLSFMRGGDDFGSLKSS